MVVERKELAGFWRRFGAYALDSVILSIVNLVLYLILAIISAFIYGFSSAGGTGTRNSSNFAALFGLAYCGSIIFGFIIMILYFSWFESSSYQATPGKMAVGMKVVDLNGERISFGKAIARNILKIISGLILGLGYAIIGFSEKRQGLHDIIVGTTVVMNEIKYL